MDFTDHVWVEVYGGEERGWIMADSCEGLIDVPQMYEQGWGKKLNYILSFQILGEMLNVEVVDVTRRYTRLIRDDEFVKRRRAVVTNEFMGEMMIAQFNEQWRNKESDIFRECQKRGEEEEFFLKWTVGREWDKKENVTGRISGSYAWKMHRNELGAQSGYNDAVEEKRKKVPESKT